MVAQLWSSLGLALALVTGGAGRGVALDRPCAPDQGSPDQGAPEQASTGGSEFQRGLERAFEAWLASLRDGPARTRGAERDALADELLDWAQRGSARAWRLLLAWLEGDGPTDQRPGWERTPALARALAAIARDEELAARALLCEARHAAQGAPALHAELIRRYPRSRAAARSRDDLWRARHLAPGQSAPALVGQDLFGNEVRLDDHLGRVTVLRFLGVGVSADRVAASGAALSDAFWDAPFTLIDIVRTPGRRPWSDLDPETSVGLAAEPARGPWPAGWRAEWPVVWPVVWDGAKGPIASRWRQHPGPATFVLDVEGRIRLATPDPDGELLRATVEELLIEARDRSAPPRPPEPSPQPAAGAPVRR